MERSGEDGTQRKAAGSAGPAVVPAIASADGSGEDSLETFEGGGAAVVVGGWGGGGELSNTARRRKKRLMGGRRR